ncbi:COP9 signalosome complex subunit 4 [Coemansia aciculifera]|uniref:COP9 signalosome complex subunit 4 n=1 Tax=Coemansia aciculifera TaxID=417176 RepID=A0ACC1LZM1_9FUNG|nr:COP9 signalosome complex subunit 4 [Coemansia aciculifera]
MSQIEQLASELSSLLRGEADGLEGISRSFLEAKLASLRHNDPSSSADDLKRLLFDVIDASLAEQVGLAGTTAVLQELVCLVGQPEQELGVRAQQDVYRHLLSKIQQRQMAYEGVIIGTRKALAKSLAAEERWEDAARQLQSIRFEQLQGSQNIAAVFPVYIWTTQLFLQAENLEQAVLSLNRAAAHIIQVSDVEQIMQYRFVQARVLSQTHKYIEAAIVYNNIFQANTRDAAEQRAVLGQAINCAVLAAASPQKMRVLSGLYREQLASTLPSFGLMEKMVLKRLIKPTELEQFDQQLEKHQRELVAGSKSTVLSSAVREHNIFVLSSLYTSIRFENLGRLLGIDTEEAELMCARMIAEGRMKGRIDQVDGVITFEGAREVKEVAAAISMKRQDAVQAPPMHFREMVHARWDGRIVNLCQSIEDAVDMLIERQPVYARTLFRRV